ncbi:MAG TPA: tripartite tricarboxylate transporter substrate binding protein [Methylomirabilota bacterium]|nr:tripartite tricarboxylate transporter substrate binding protein [Methylomirabilota bacterium]
MIRGLLAGLLALLPLAGWVAAQEPFPTRPVTIVSPYPPGGAADLTARPFAPALERVLKQPVVVLNKPGAGGAVGTQSVAVAKPDGYTIMLTVFSISTIPEADRVAGRTPTFTRDQFVPIARLNADPTLLMVPTDAPWKTVKDLVEDAKKRPNAILYASAGNYTVSHMAIEVFMQAAGIKLRHLPTTGGGPAMTAVLGGHATLSALSTGAVTPQVKAGKVRVLANSGAKRLEAFPDVPTLKELGYDVEVYLWTGLFAPKDVPAPVLKTIRDAVRRAVQDDEFKAASEKMQMPPAYQDADEFKAWWDKDTEMLANAIRRMGKPGGG